MGPQHDVLIRPARNTSLKKHLKTVHHFSCACCMWCTILRRKGCTVRLRWCRGLGRWSYIRRYGRCVYHIGIKFLPQVCIILASILHHICIILASGLHNMCIRFASCSHPLLDHVGSKFWMLLCTILTT